MRDFDDRMTCIIFGYESVHQFYSTGSSVTRIKDVRIPLLCINAEDDPISVADAMPTKAQVEANPNVILCVTKSGGHLAFYESGYEPDDQSLDQQKPQNWNVWSVKVIAEFAESIRLAQQS